jgi:glucan 1,3-beta-glucosidase
LEGAVGGHWGLIDAWSRAFKFTPGEAVSNHPGWRWQALGGTAMAAAIFGAAFFSRRRDARGNGVVQWLAVALMAAAAGALIGWVFENVLIESFDYGSWLQSLLLAAVAVLAPIVCAWAMCAGNAIPSFAQVLARRDQRLRDPLTLALGAVLILLTVAALQAALGLVFNPRYRDFPFAPLTAAAVPFLILSLMRNEPLWGRGVAETAAALLLATSAVYIVFNESFENWQSVWLCAALIVLAFILVRVRAAPG